jgi:hypothetical protein
MKGQRHQLTWPALAAAKTNHDRRLIDMQEQPLTPAEQRKTFERLLARACDGQPPPTCSGLNSDVIEALQTIARGPGAPASLVDAAREIFKESVR